MDITREKKLALAKEIIEESKIRGLYRPMSNGQYSTQSLLANSHSLKELRELYRSIVGT